VKSITTFQSPPADNLYRLVEVHCVHNFEQPLLLWAVIAGLWAGPCRAEVSCGPCWAGPGCKMAWKLRAGSKIFGPCTCLLRSHALCEM